MRKTIQAITLATLTLTSISTSHNLYAATSESQEAVVSHSKGQHSKQSRELPTEEKVGISIGAVIGGIFGGPPGAFITAIAGDFIGKHVVASQKIDDMEADMLAQTRKIQLTEHQHQLAMQQAEQELLALNASYEKNANVQAENILTSLLFRTGSSEIEPQYKQQVIALAQILKQSPNLHIDLQGYTDKQGETEINQALSLQRVQSVKQLLVKQGVSVDRINTSAHGEMSPLDQQTDNEVNYFDRRVVMKLTRSEQAIANVK